MEGQFLRRNQKPRWLRGITSNVFKTRRRAMLVIGCLIVLGYVLFNNRGVIARLRLENERRAMIEKIAAAEEETKRLQAYLKALEGDKKTIEKVARERYGMVRPGETVYRAKKDSGK